MDHRRHDDPLRRQNRARHLARDDRAGAGSLRGRAPAPEGREALVLQGGARNYGRHALVGRAHGYPPRQARRRMLEEGKSPREVDRVLRDTYYVSPERRRLAIEAAQAGLRAKRALAPDEISLYIGIPFCPTRCAYCSFVSQAVEKTFRLMDPYLDVLCREITDAARMVRETGLRVKSFYMGGGTPTTLSAQQMDRLLTHLNRSFDLSDCAEYCVEAGRPTRSTARSCRCCSTTVRTVSASTRSRSSRACSKPSAANTRPGTSCVRWSSRRR